MINYLTLEQVLRLHEAAVQQFGGLNGIRDSNLLLSSIESPSHSMYGIELHPTIYDKAAAYLFNIVCNHPFNDGNKRTGSGCAYLFLRINKIPISFEASFENEIFENLVVKVARGKIKKNDVAYFLKHGKEYSFDR